MDPQVERLVEMLKALQVEGAPRLWELPPKVARGVADSMFTSMFNDAQMFMLDIAADAVDRIAVFARAQLG
jgi:hypothetical protein